MTETTAEQTEPDTEVPAPEPDTEDNGTDEATHKARTDAAGYRRRLRDTEAERDSIAAERDALVEKLTARQRTDVEVLAAQRLTDGSDLWQAVELVDVLNEAGDIDEAKVTADVADLLTRKPHYGIPRVDNGLGYRSMPPRSSGWEDVLRGGTSRRFPPGG
jgi:hypothetical protein